MADLSQYSDEELARFAAQPAAKPKLDVSSLTDKQLEAISNGRTPIEHEDAPTTGQLELPGVDMSFLPEGMRKVMGLSGKEGLTLPGAAATKFGTLSTGNPRARQEIYTKHLPGAKAVDDKFGNPGVEYKGKFYYTSRPGEFDIMDAGRLTAGVAGGVAATALTPAFAVSSVPAAVATTGLLGAGQSLAEDAAAIASGGKSQDLDAKKALISGGLGALGTAGISALVPIARNLYGRFAGEVFDAAGAPTARGARILQEAGITAEQSATMTPQMRQEITQAVNSNFGSSTAAGVAQRRALGTEFDVPQTQGGLLDDPAQIGLEKNLRGGSRGEYPQRIIQEFDETQREALTQAQEMIRRQAGGGRVLDPSDAGQVLGTEFRTANTAARNQVTAAYDRAFNPEELARRGIASDVQIERIQGLPNAIEDHFTNATRSGGALIPTRTNTPTAMEAIDRLRQFAQNGSIPSAIPRATTAEGAAEASRATPTAVGWEQIDLMRKQISRLRGSIPNTPDRAADRDAMGTVMRAFDEHLAQGNPLLREAIDTAAERFGTFLPNARTQTPLTQQVLKFLNKPESAQEGAEVINKLVGGKLKSGEALGAVDHLLTVHPAGSPGHQVMAEQALRKIFVDGERTRTPQQIVTAINKALGPEQGDVYRRLLSPEQINQLMRFRDLNENIASATRLINPSGSGHLAVSEARKAARATTGGGVGSWIASILFQNPAMHALGGAAGALAGKATGQTMNIANAARAVTPGPNVGGVAAGPIAGQAGLLSQQPIAQSQPIDRLWQGLLSP